MYMIKTPHPVHLLLGPLPSWGVAAGAGEGGPPSLAHLLSPTRMSSCPCASFPSQEPKLPKMQVDEHTVKFFHVSPCLSIGDSSEIAAPVFLPPFPHTFFQRIQ